MRKRIIGIYEHEKMDIEREENQLQTAFAGIPLRLSKLSEDTGIDQNTLITIIGRIAVLNEDLFFARLLELFLSFHTMKHVLEEEK